MTAPKLHNLTETGYEVDALQAVRLDQLERETLDAIAASKVVVNATDIAAATGLDASAIQFALHRLDDAGRVIMRCGFYRLSEAERSRRSAAQCEVAHSAPHDHQSTGSALTGQERGQGE